MSAYDARTALIAVDVQNDFASPDGSLYVTRAEEAVAAVVEAIAAARVAGALVVCTQDWHPPVTPHFEKDGGIWPAHCVEDTWGAAFHPDLPAGLEAVRKGADGRDGYSGFSVRDPATGETTPTPLVDVLRRHDIERLVVCGLATDYCVVETVVDARMLGYPVHVLLEGIRAVDLAEGDGIRAIARMREAGAKFD
ncbi:MAG: isochorismatase family protein [Actinomycetota bacterium]